LLRECSVFCYTCGCHAVRLFHVRRNFNKAFMIMTRFRAKAVMTPLCGVEAIDIDQLESLHMHARGYAAVGHMVKTAPAATLAPAQGNGGAGGMAANVKVVNLLDPGDVMEAGVSRSIGEKEFFNFITRNSRATEGALS
jgi:hypothetical protein